MGNKKEKLSKRNSKTKSKSNSRRAKYSIGGGVELYCLCRLPWDGNSLMVQCDHCFDWFHPRCVGVSSKEAKSVNPFICPSCQDKPILKLINYKMESYKKNIQFSYYENINPIRLNQFYSITDIPCKNNDKISNHLNHNIIDLNQLIQIKNNIINSNNNNNNNNDAQFMNQIILYATQKKNKIERQQIETISECNKYMLSCLFGKHLDLTANICKSKPYLISKIINDKNISSKMDIQTLMCLNCNGQIPANTYNSHINKCLYFKYNNNNKKNEHENENVNPDLYFDTILFDTNYKFKCIPTNPFLKLIESESESDINNICPIDINNRKKVIKKLIKNKNKYTNRHKHKNKNKQTINENILLPPKKNKDLEIFHKIYTKLIPLNDEIFYEESPDEFKEENIDFNKCMLYDSANESVNESDDDIPIAINIKNNNNNNNNINNNGYNLRQRQQINKEEKKQIIMNNNIDKKEENINVYVNNNNNSNITNPNTNSNTKEKYLSEYKQIENKFKKYKHFQKLKHLKTKQKKYAKMRLNENKNQLLIYQQMNKYNLKLKNDQIIINKLYKQIFPLNVFNSNKLKSNKLLNKLKFCNINNLKLKHCAFLYNNKSEDNKHENENENENEEKTMRMDIDSGHNMTINETDAQTQKNDNGNFEYFCSRKLNKNGMCPMHKNWRIEKYKKLVNHLQNETKEIFLLKCLIKELKNKMIQNKKYHQIIQNEINLKFEQSLNNKTFYNHMNLFDFNNNINNINPCIPINIDSNETDIDFLIQTKLKNKTNNNDNNENTLEQIESNAVLYPQNK